MGKTKFLILFAMVIAVITASAGAGVIFTESFEEPDITGSKKLSTPYGAPDITMDAWNCRQKYTGLVDIDINASGTELFINPFGQQVAYVFGGGSDTATMTTSVAGLSDTIKADTTYTLKFNTASEEGITEEYHVQLMAIADDGTETLLTYTRESIASNDLAANPRTLIYRSGPTPANLGERIAIRLRKGAGDWHYDVYYDNISLSSDPMNASPYDGEKVNGGTVDLSWTNMAPNVGDTVWVDVWVGTDPCDIMGATSEKVLDGGENATTAQFTAEAGTTYYWQIISYLNGDAVTDPYSSDIYSFTTSSDVAPELVDILTPDMVTWSGEPVALTSEVIDDGASALTYTWTSIPADGVEFTPSANDPNPTVTITKPVGLSVLPIANYGFENPRDAKDGNGFVPYPDGDRDYTGHLISYIWTFPNWGYHFNGYCGVLNPTTDAYPDEAPEGENVGFVQSAISGSDPYYNADGGLTISTANALKPNTNYTLSVKVGNPLFNDAFPGYRIQLLAGGAVLVQDANSLNVEPGTFVTSEINYTSGATVNPGQNLGIRLIALMGSHKTDIDSGDTSVYEVHFDDVKLLTDGDSTYAITLSVNDENNPSKEDSMMIDVFDTACQATIIGMGIKGNGDFSGDCFVDMNDFQGLAATWLNDHTLSDTTATPGGDSGNADDPNAIDAGADMLTWSGMPLALDGTVGNDANTPQWSVDQASLDDTNLTISIANANAEDTSVTITKAVATGDVTKVTMTLSVSDKEDSMVIDVYDDSCKAAAGIDPLVIEDADFNSDCKTNIEDFSVMAIKWLSTTTVEGPGVKP